MCDTRRWYTHARTLEPRSGRPYNQLALLAVLTKRSFEAVYFYMRSLATPAQPILTARESLMALFNDSRRKVRAVFVTCSCEIIQFHISFKSLRLWKRD